ncbi:MAG: hypothetical protein V4539_17090 [Bacteroidota bacterium]
MQHLPGTILIILGFDCNPVGEVEVDHYLQSDKAYHVWWTYPQTGEREKIKVPEWRLTKKLSDNNKRVKTSIKESYADRFFRN